MRLEQLYYIVETARYRSMSKAAKKLFIAQPSLSTAVLALEEELGFPIFRRSSQGVTLTARGQTVLTLAEGIVQQAEEIKALATHNHPNHSELSLVAVPAACNSLILGLIPELQKAFPQLDMNIIEMRPRKIIRSLVAGPATIALGSFYPSTKEIVYTEAAKHNLTVEVIYQDHMYLFVNSLHPLIQRQAVYLDDLTNYTQAIFKDNTMMLPIDGKNERKSPTSTRRQLTFSDRESIKKIVAQGYAYAILPGQMAYDDFYVTSGKIRVLPLRDCPVQLSVYLAYPEGNALSETELYALETIRRLYAELPPGPAPLTEDAEPLCTGGGRQIYY